MSETKNTNNNANQGDSSDTSLNNGRLYQRRIRTFEQPEVRRPGAESAARNEGERAPSRFPEFRKHRFPEFKKHRFPITDGSYEPAPIYRQPLPSREEIQASIKQGAIEFRAEYERKYGKKEKHQVQAKPLTVSAPDDPLEKEADRMADTVLRMEAMPEEEELQHEAIPEDEELQREAIPAEDEELQREAMSEEEELQREEMPEEDEELQRETLPEDEEIARSPAPPALRPAPQVNTAETALYRALAELSKTPEPNPTPLADSGYVARLPGSNGTRRVNGKVIRDRQQNLIQMPTGPDGIQRVLMRDARGIKIVERHPPGKNGIARQKVYRMTVAEAARAGALGQSEEPLQRANDGALKTSVDTATRIESKRGGGETLHDSDREFFETRMDADFSGVRIHRDAEAASLAKDVNAKAFTIGGDVFFNEGQYQPGSSAGKRLIAHELTHTVQQGAAERIAREPEGEIQREKEGDLIKKYAPARNFHDLIALVREAELKLIRYGYTSVDDRIHVLRGIYYGTKWSADFKKEKSETRNVGFSVYTGFTPVPDDPQKILGNGLFEALLKSQDVTDGGRHIDFGHLLIGLDARRSTAARSFKFPTMGGSGLAIVTWLGDLGGGTGMLAFKRVNEPELRAVSVFRGTDFGGSINLEGDIAGYLVGRDPAATNGASAISIPEGRGIADALQSYLFEGGPDTDWGKRSALFIQMLGGELDQKGGLKDHDRLLNDLAVQIEEFACWYLWNRLRDQNRLTSEIFAQAAKHITGASREVALIFIEALMHSIQNPGDRIAARGSGPEPSPPGPINSVCKAILLSIPNSE